MGRKGGKKARKSFFAGVPNGACDGKGGKGLKAPDSGLVGALTSVWSGVTLFQTMSGPTWLPPKQPEPPRVPQGRALPRGALGPPTAHGASKCSLTHTREGQKSHWPPSFTFSPLPVCFLLSLPQARGPCSCATFPNSWSVPRLPGTGKRRAAPRRAALTRYLSPVAPLLSPFSAPASPQGQLLPPPT